jgi:hypothetical protein
MAAPTFITEGFKEGLIEFLSKHFIYDSTNIHSKQELEVDMLEIFKVGYRNKYQKDEYIESNKNLIKEYKDFINSIKKQCEEFIKENI